jgi:penicillin amidase
MNWMFDHFIMNRFAEWSADETEGMDEEWCFNEENIKLNAENEKAGRPRVPACIYNIVHSFYDAHLYLLTNFGLDKSNWQWSQIHNHRFVHSPFSETPLKRFFERKYPGEGSRRTINVGGVNVKERDWDAKFSPNYRMVVSMDPNEKSYYVVDTGINENIFSKHYDDQMELHRNGHFIEM